MSLIKCPECGREKVSDTAIACPDCGFAIREYFERQKKEEVHIPEKNDLSAKPAAKETAFDTALVISQMDAHLNELLIRKAAYWYHKSPDTYNFTLSKYATISQIEKCNMPNIGTYEFLDYVVSEIDGAFQQCQGQQYNTYVKKLCDLLGKEKYRDFWNYGSKIYFLKALHLDVLKTETLKKVALFISRGNFTIWSMAELETIFAYLGPADQKTCISYYGERYEPEICDDIDLGGLYKEWESCKRKNQPMDSAVIDKYRKVVAKRDSTKEVHTTEVPATKNSTKKVQKDIGTTQKKSSSNLKEVPMPEKPTFSKAYIIGTIIGALIFLLGGSSVATDEVSRQNSINHGNGDPVFQGVYLMIFGVVIIIVVLGIFERQRSRYNLAMNDYNAYKDLIKKEQEEAERQREAERKAREEKLAKTPKCPVCGSQNVKNISTLNRSVSVAAFGLASSKIGKQYECKNCNHKW